MLCKNTESNKSKLKRQDTSRGIIKYTQKQKLSFFRGYFNEKAKLVKFWFISSDFSLL